MSVSRSLHIKASPIKYFMSHYPTFASSLPLACSWHLDTGQQHEENCYASCTGSMQQNNLLMNWNIHACVHNLLIPLKRLNVHELYEIRHFSNRANNTKQILTVQLKIVSWNRPTYSNGKASSESTTISH